MADDVVMGASLTVGGTEFAGKFRSLNADDGYEELENTGIGDTVRQAALGVASNFLGGQLKQDFAASQVEAVLRPLLKAKAPVTVVLKPKSGATSVTNPAWTNRVLISRLPIVSGGAGALNAGQIRWRLLDDWTKATA